MASDVGSATKIAGGGGADSITISGDTSNKASVLGGAGGDTIQIQGFSANTTGVFIGGGAGSDSIFISADGNMTGSGTIQGGGGVDSINISGAQTGNEMMIYGGAGADIIGLGTFTTGTGANVAYSAFADSNVDAIDQISGSSVSGARINVKVSAITNTLRLDSLSNATLHVSGGIATGDGFSANSIGSAASIMDGALGTKGASVIFTQSGSNYLFIQGGTSGTSDDLLVEFASGLALSGASAVTVGTASGTVSLTFKS